MLAKLPFQTTFIFLNHGAKYIDDLVRQPRLRTYMTIMLTRIYMTAMLTQIVNWKILQNRTSLRHKISTYEFGHMQFNIRQVPGKTLKGPAGVRHQFP